MAWTHIYISFISTKFVFEGTFNVHISVIISAIIVLQSERGTFYLYRYPYDGDKKFLAWVFDGKTCSPGWRRRFVCSRKMMVSKGWDCRLRFRDVRLQGTKVSFRKGFPEKSSHPFDAAHVFEGSSWEAAGSLDAEQWHYLLTAEHKDIFLRISWTPSPRLAVRPPTLETCIAEVCYA